MTVAPRGQRHQVRLPDSPDRRWRANGPCGRAEGVGARSADGPSYSRLSGQNISALMIQGQAADSAGDGGFGSCKNAVARYQAVVAIGIWGFRRACSMRMNSYSE